MARATSQKNLEKYMKKINAAEQNRDANYRALWGRCYKRYRNHVDPLIDEKTRKVLPRSNISIPYTFTQVETILPRLVETLFAARPYVTVKGREPQDDGNAVNMETLLDWQMNERFDVQELFHIGLKEMCIYGTTVSFVGWRLDERKVIKKQLEPVMINGTPLTEPHPVTGQDAPVQDWQPVQTTTVEYDDPEVKFIDLGDFYVDPYAEDVEGSRYAGHRCYETKEYIQKMHDQGLWKIDWRKIPKESKRMEALEYRQSLVGLNTQNANTDHDEDGMYEVHYYFEDDKMVVIINRLYIAMEGENPFWHKKKPYVKDVYTKVPHEFYGMGVVEMLEDLQDELNNERNMRIDFRAFLLRRMWKVKRTSNIDPNQLVWRQGGVVLVDELDDIEEIGIKEVPSSTFTEEQTIKKDMQDTSGAQDVVMGQSGAGETATTTMSKDNNASMRFKLIISSVEKRLLVGISRFMMQLNQQLVDTDRMIRVAGKSGDEWLQLSPEDIQGEFDLVAAGSSVEPMANKEAFKQRMVELYGIAAKDPFMQQFPDKRRNLLKKVFEAFDMKETDDLLPSDDELHGVMQQQMMQELVAQLPPEVQQMIMPYLSQQQPAATPPAADGMPPGGGGGANTAAQSEAGLQLVQGGAGQ